MKTPYDWKGEPIPEDEPDDKEVWAWHIEPPDDYCDYYLIRDYYDAMEAAERCVALAMDQTDEPDPASTEKEFTAFRVSLERTTVGQLRAIGSMPPLETTS